MANDVDLKRNREDSERRFMRPCTEKKDDGTSTPSICQAGSDLFFFGVLPCQWALFR